ARSSGARNPSRTARWSNPSPWMCATSLSSNCASTRATTEPTVPARHGLIHLSSRSDSWCRFPTGNVVERVMSEDELNDHIKAANTALSSMRDKGARWWNYCVSHRTFDMVIGDPMGNDNIALCLPACAHLSGPVKWDNQRIEVVVDP